MQEALKERYQVRDYPISEVRSFVDRVWPLVNNEMKTMSLEMGVSVEDIKGHKRPHELVTLEVRCCHC